MRRYIPILLFINLSFTAHAQETQLSDGDPQFSNGLLLSYYQSKVDCLIQAKVHLLQGKLSDLKNQTNNKHGQFDSTSNIGSHNWLDGESPGLAQQKCSNQMIRVNGLLNEYKSKVADTEELAWIENYTGRLKQLEGVISQYQNKLLNLEELEVLRGYEQQLQQLSPRIQRGV